MRRGEPDPAPRHRTVVVPVRLSGGDHRRAHEACHVAALLWNRARRWSLRIAVPTTMPPQLDPERVVGVDEGIINSMSLCAEKDGDLEVVVINGREARAIKRRRNKAVGKLQRGLGRCTSGWRRHRKLTRRRKRETARASSQLRDFNHQVTRKAARFAQAHDAGRVVVGDVRGIEQETERRRRARRHTRQQLSQWERGAQEAHLAFKLGVMVEHVDESYSSQTCPVCGARNRPRGRSYRCGCGFTCHRDAVGAVNIHQRARYGYYRPLDPGTEIRVTYLRAVPRFSARQARAWSSRSGTGPSVAGGLPAPRAEVA